MGKPKEALGWALGLQIEKETFRLLDDMDAFRE